MYLFSTGSQHRYSAFNSGIKIQVKVVVVFVLYCCFTDTQIFQTAIWIIYQKATMCCSCRLTDQSCSSLSLVYGMFGKLGYVCLSCCVFSLESSIQPAKARQEHICLLTHRCVFSGETSLLECGTELKVMLCEGKKTITVKIWSQHSQCVCSSPPERTVNNQPSHNAFHCLIRLWALREIQQALYKAESLTHRHTHTQRKVALRQCKPYFSH